MTYPTTRPATWFVTGASRGLGLELVRQLLDRGDNVAATSRSAERLVTALDGSTSRLLALEVNLRDEQAVSAAIASTIDRFGDLDVVVNNAGYGFLAAVEEVTDAQARDMFDVQLFGAWNVLRSALPTFRAKRSGHVINVSSIVGLVAFPGWGLYAAGKFAIEGLSASLAGEVAGLGIDVTIVEPGYLRTDFLKPVSLGVASTEIEGYEAIREMTAAHQAMPGTQLGDPVRAAAAIIDVAASGDAPLHQLLGSDSYGIATGAIAGLSQEFEAGHARAITTDIPEVN